MKKLLRLVIDDAAHGDAHTLIGIIDWLIEQGVSLNRIIEIAERHFNIPRATSIETLKLFV